MAKKIETEDEGMMLDGLEISFGMPEEIVELEEEEIIEEDPEEDPEEDDDPEVEEKDPEEEEEEEKPAPGKNQLTVIAKHLDKSGIIDVPDEFDGSEESFNKLFEDRIEKGIQEYKDSILDEEAKKFIEFKINGGKTEDFIKIFSQKDFDNVKDDDVDTLEDVDDDIKRNDLRKEVIAEALRISGDTDEVIKKKIKRYEDTGVLADEAKDALWKVKKFRKEQKDLAIEKTKMDAKAREKAFEEMRNTLRKQIDEDSEKIIGIKLTKKEKDSFFDFITKINPGTKKTALMEARASDPNFDLKVAFAAFNGFEKIAKGKQKESVSSLEQQLRDLSNNSSKSTNIKHTNKNSISRFRQVIED